MLTVHLRINDAATGKPTPVRLRVSGPDGTYFAPLGHAAEFACGRNEDVGGNLSRRPRPVRVHRRVVRDQTTGRGAAAGAGDEGPGVRAARRDGGPRPREDGAAVRGDALVRPAGRRLVSRRHPGPLPHPALGRPGSRRGGRLRRQPAGVRQPFPSLDGTIYPSYPNLTAFSGQQPALQTDAALVAVNTLNVHPVLGSVGLLHSHRAIYPLTFGGGDDTDDWSVSDWCDQCHRKNGLTVWTDPFNPGGGEALVGADTREDRRDRVRRPPAKAPALAALVSAAERRVPRPAGRRQRQGLERRPPRHAADVRPAEARGAAHLLRMDRGGPGRTVLRHQRPAPPLRRRRHKARGRRSTCPNRERRSGSGRPPAV